MGWVGKTSSIQLNRGISHTTHYHKAQSNHYHFFSSCLSLNYFGFSVFKQVLAKKLKNSVKR